MGIYVSPGYLTYLPPLKSFGRRRKDLSETLSNYASKQSLGSISLFLAFLFHFYSVVMSSIHGNFDKTAAGTDPTPNSRRKHGASSGTA